MGSMARRALLVACVVTAALSAPAAAYGAPPVKPPGELRVCGNGAAMDVFVDKAELHKEKRDLADGKCKSFSLPKGKYAVTVVGHCATNADARLADLAVAPASRALYSGTSLAGARVVRESTTTWTATWECLGATQAGATPFNP
jgi:hypothetical protein